MPELVGLLAASFSAGERLEAAHAIGSLAASNTAVARTIVQAGAVPHLVALLSCPDLTAHTAAAVCLAELVQNAPGIQVSPGAGALLSPPPAACSAAAHDSTGPQSALHGCPERLVASGWSGSRSSDVPHKSGMCEPDW